MGNEHPHAMFVVHMSVALPIFAPFLDRPDLQQKTTLLGSNLSILEA